MEGIIEVHGRWCWVLTRRARVAKHVDAIKKKQSQRRALCMSANLPQALVASIERTMKTLTLTLTHEDHAPPHPSPRAHRYTRRNP
jgi:hypothetical protein